MVSRPPEQTCWPPRPRPPGWRWRARRSRPLSRVVRLSIAKWTSSVGSSRRQCATLSRPGSWRPRSRPSSRPSPGPTSVDPPRSRPPASRAEAFAGAAAALADLEATWGDAVALAGRLERARALAAGRGVQAERRAEVAALAAAIPPAEAMAATATTTATDATTHERSALDAERAAVDALEAARAADRVAAVSAGLAVGDPVRSADGRSSPCPTGTGRRSSPRRRPRSTVAGRGRRGVGRLPERRTSRRRRPGRARPRTRPTRPGGGRARPARTGRRQRRARVDRGARGRPAGGPGR